MFRYRTYWYTVATVFLIVSSFVFAASQEQWKKDQNAGKFWYVGRGGIYTHDPYENNPGTLVVIPSSENTEIRIYPDIPFTRNGETRVRYVFGSDKTQIEDTSFELWPTELLLGRQGYVRVPENIAGGFLNEAEAAGAVVLEMIDKNDESAVRTFGYDEAYAELRDSDTSLAIPDETGKYMVTFTVTPKEASVVVYSRGLLGTEVAEGNGPSFNLELRPGKYRYESTLRDYVEQKVEFQVPETTQVEVEMKAPGGLLGILTEGGLVSPKTYGNDWPLTVRRGIVECESPRKLSIITGKGTFALNREAEDEFPSVESIVKDVLNDENVNEKLDITPIIEKALAMCE